MKKLEVSGVCAYCPQPAILVIRWWWGGAISKWWAPVHRACTQHVDRLLDEVKEVAFGARAEAAVSGETAAEGLDRYRKVTALLNVDPAEKP